MSVVLGRRFRCFAILFLLLLPALLPAEKVADLPMPTSYVNDFAHVLSPASTQQMEGLARALHNQANADVAIVTIKSLDDGQSVEEFTAALEEKWKLGKKGSDRSAIYLLVLSPHKLRIETGYGLEGILNDAKVGAILDKAKPYAAQGDYDDAMLTGEQGLTDVIAADAHVTLAPVVHRYHRQAASNQQPQGFGLGRIVLGIGFVILLFILIKTGNLGWAFVLLQMFAGGGGSGGGGGGRDDDSGGGFGGSGGGMSGGGGASRDF